VFLSFFILLGSQAPLLATTPTTFLWDGGGANTNWADANNWTNSTAPASSANNIIHMSGTLQLTNTAAARTIHSLVYKADAGPFVTYGGTITIDDVAGITQNSTNSQTITNAITLSANQTWTVHSNSLVLTTGLLDLGTTDFTINNNTNVFLDGVITGGSGVRALTKNSNGFLHLAGVNTFQQDVVVNAGVLLISANDALGNTSGDTTINSGSTLGFSNNLSYTTAEALGISGTGQTGLGALHNFQGDNSFGANITLAGNSLLRMSGGSLLLGGTIDLGGNLLAISNSAASFVRLTNIVSSTGGSLELYNGTLHLSRINTFTGNVTNHNGTIIVSSSNALGTAAGVTVIESGATLAFSNNVQYGTVEGVMVSGAGVGGNGSIQNIHGTNLFGGPVTLAADSTIKVATNILYLQGAVTNAGFRVTSVVNPGTLLGYSNVISGTGGLTVDGGGTVTLFRSNTFSGSIIVTNASTLNLGSSHATTTNNIILGGGTLAASRDGSTNVFGNLTLTSNSTISLNSGGSRSTFIFTNATYVDGYLVIDNWADTIGTSGTDDRIYFTNDPGDFVKIVNFTGYGSGGIWLPATGELVPAPEPSAYFAVAFLALLMGARYVKPKKPSVSEENESGKNSTGTGNS
jgi:autotransporter-associated beta strand protein